MSVEIALEMSTEGCSVALNCRGQVSSRFIVEPRIHAQKILPYIDELLVESNVALSDITSIYTGIGPGAFTGVRIAVSVAQGLSLALGIDVFPVSTLLLLAEQQRQSNGAERVLVIQDARMGQIYAAAYRYIDGRWQCELAPMVCDPEKLPFEFGATTDPWILTGNGKQYLHRLPFIVEAHSFVDVLPQAEHAFRLRDQLMATAAELLVPEYVRNDVTY